jgi:hypothetical protein
MTRTLRWLVGFALVIASIAGCSVNHRSGDFACEKQADCSTGRTCIDGYCVALQADASVPIDSSVKTDAAPPIDANNGCPQPCTSCNSDSKTCNIDCMSNGGACNGPLRCPEGWNCNVLCSLAGSCSNGLVCPPGQFCKVTCSGRQSCNQFTCNTGRCDIECLGANSCTSLSCGAACACDINCVNTTSCGSKIACKSDLCTDGRGCTSTSIPATTCNMCLVF